MNWRIASTIFRKEILDTLRDKRTLIMMVGVPIVLYPMLMLLVMQVALVQQSSMDATVSRVAIQMPDPAMAEAWLKEAEKVELVKPVDGRAALDAGDVDAVVVIEAHAAEALASGESTQVSILYDRTEFRSLRAADRVRNALNKALVALRAERLAAAGMNEAYITPLRIVDENIAPPKKTSGTLLGAILPTLMIIMIALGAFYPAVDLTAGEKERGTFETLLSTPCTKLEIVSGKFMAVFLQSILVGLLNFLSMSATLAFAFSQAGSSADGGAPLIAFELPLSAFPIALVMLVPLAFLISAAMMSIAVLARSFKDAQNYMTPFFMLILLPAVIAGLPGIELTPITQLIPIANVVLLFKELMIGEATLAQCFTVFLTTAVFATLALLLAAWLFQREEVILSEERGVPLTLNRKLYEATSVPTPGMAMTLFCGIMVMILYLGSLAQGWDILLGLVFTEYVLILLPVVAALWYFKISFRETLSLRGFGLGSLAGMLLCTFGGLIFVVELGAWNNKVLPVPEEMQAAFAALFSGGSTLGGLVVLLLVVALSPAVCEEALFRGVMLSALRRRMHTVAVVLVVGLLFGLFHLSIYRVAGTAAIGVLLTYIVLRGGSIYLSVIAHGLINGISILIATKHAPAPLLQWLEAAEVESQGLPWTVLAAGLALLLVGVALLERQRPPER